MKTLSLETPVWEKPKDPRPGGYRDGVYRWAALILVGILLYSTNPTEAQFKEYLAADLQKTHERSDDNALTGDAGDLLTKPDGTTGHLTETKNLQVFSVYTVEGPEGSYLYIGVLNNFVRIR